MNIFVQRFLKSMLSILSEEFRPSMYSKKTTPHKSLTLRALRSFSGVALESERFRKIIPAKVIGNWNARNCTKIFLLFLLQRTLGIALRIIQGTSKCGTDLYINSSGFGLSFSCPEQRLYGRWNCRSHSTYPAVEELCTISTKLAARKLIPTRSFFSYFNVDRMLTLRLARSQKSRWIFSGF